MFRSTTPKIAFLLVTVAALLFGAATPSSASTPPAGSVGVDVSFPQCGMQLPKDAAFGIVGVNGGRSFTRNPCLATQLAWAKRAPNHGPSFYANTGNPGPAYSPRWPVGQTFPRACHASNPNSRNCSYDYGWNSAKQSFATAVSAVAKLDHVDRDDATGRAAAVPWWLDVETMNSWQTLETGYAGSSQAKANDTAALLGSVHALWDEGISRVGIYSTSLQWKQITGGRAYTRDSFSANPVWRAGYESASDAVSGCGDGTFTGGPLLMTQFLRGSFDGDVRCR